MSITLGNSTIMLRRKAVQAKTGLAGSTIYALMKSKIRPFPKPIRLSPRTVAWKESDIDQYIQACAEEPRDAVKGGV